MSAYACVVSFKDFAKLSLFYRIEKAVLMCPYLNDNIHECEAHGDIPKMGCDGVGARPSL